MARRRARAERERPGLLARPVRVGGLGLALLGDVEDELQAELHVVEQVAMEVPHPRVVGAPPQHIIAPVRTAKVST